MAIVVDEVIVGHLVDNITVDQIVVDEVVIVVVIIIVNPHMDTMDIVDLNTDNMMDMGIMMGIMDIKIVDNTTIIMVDNVTMVDHTIVVDHVTIVVDKMVDRKMLAG